MLLWNNISESIGYCEFTRKRIKKMNSTLKEVISEKCRKKVISLESNSENEGEVEEMEEKESEIIEELPFEDILADKRRKYSAKEEFIFLLYNDSLQYFVKE